VPPAAPLHAESAYADRRQREHALRLGMWVFLGSETLLFAGLFALYAGYRARYPAAFAHAGAHNEEWIGSINTFVLIVSSFFAAWAIHLVRGGRVRGAMVSLGAVVLLGLTFLGLKSLEYTHHLREGIAPGAYYHFALDEQGARLFFTLYYFMTGLHALHVLAGLTVMVWLVTRLARGLTTPEQHVELEMGGLYWHLVDIVWIFLWPLLYLST
jgi:cytochrome c oxidase subunit 3